ncbi:MAG: hypothetical protein V3V10_04760 [Planctomycetota bacterium]
MKKWALILVAAFAATTFAACGGHNDADNHGHNESGGHGDHDDDEHAKMHDSAKSLGSKEVDGYKISLELAIGEKDSGAAIAIEKDGKAVTDATVVVIILDAAGEQVGASANGNYEDENKDYDAHLAIPKEHEGFSLKVRVIHGGGDPKEVTFEIK